MRNLLLVSVVVLAIGCRNGSPTSPGADAPVVPAGTAVAVNSSLSGVVYESTPAGLRPLAGVPLDVSVEYQSWSPRVTSDAQGRYALPGTGLLKVRAEYPGYSQPCRAAANVTEPETTVNVYLVSDAVLSTIGVPASLPVVSPAISGRVVEQTAAGVRPVPGATLIMDFSGGLGWAPSATTVSDVDGRYMLCGIRDVAGSGLLLFVNKPGYADAVLAMPVAKPDAYDIVIARK
jgi:hypothetical protein